MAPHVLLKTRAAAAPGGSPRRWDAMPTSGLPFSLGRDRAADAAVVVGADGLVQSANDAAHRVLGARTGRIYRALVSGAVDAAGRPFERDRCPVSAVLDGGLGGADVVVGLRDAQGGRGWWSLTVRPNIDASGVVRSATCTFVPYDEPAPLASAVTPARRPASAPRSGASVADDLEVLARAAHLVVPATVVLSDSPWAPPR